MSALKDAQVAAWRELQQASGLAENSPKEAWTMLSEAAQKYAKARWAAAAPPPPTRDPAAVVPFGRDKGVLLSEADTKSLNGLRRIIAENVADPAKSQWRDRNEKLLAAIDAELGTR